MPPKAPEFPKVVFRTENSEELKFGYLAIIDGVPWLAHSDEDARQRVFPLMVQLDPTHLEEDADTAEGTRFFRYRVALAVRR